MRKFIKKIAFPILNRWYQAKTKKESTYSKHGIRLKILPSVFHPGVFLSTNIIINFLSETNVKGTEILELGAGSGMISFYLAQKGAIVTATDINPYAIKGLEQNKKSTGLEIKVVNSDLFENVKQQDFELIIINPPYYPKNPLNDADAAFYCGDEFQYFHRLFEQIEGEIENDILMILSEDCNQKEISDIAKKNNVSMNEIFRKSVRGERNYIYELTRCKDE